MFPCQLTLQNLSRFTLLPLILTIIAAVLAIQLAGPMAGGFPPRSRRWNRFHATMGHSLRWLQPQTLRAKELYHVDRLCVYRHDAGAGGEYGDRRNAGGVVAYHLDVA